MFEEKFGLQTMTYEWEVSESPKKKVLMLSMFYPLSISRYFERAFQRRDDVELVTAGPYSGSFIPWSGGMNLLAKYAIPPTIQIGDFGAKLPYSLLKPRLDF